MRRLFVFLFIFIFLGVAASAQQVTFRDITAQAGIHFTHNNAAFGKKYLPETMGPGCAFIDYDNDGWPDILLVNGENWPGHPGAATTPKLYHNNHDGTFTDVTHKAGLDVPMFGLGAAIGDYDNDGFDDIFITALGQSHLFHNNGNGTFTDVTKAAGLWGPNEFSTSAAWVDYDNDGKLDLVVARYMKWDFSDLWCGEPLEGHRSYCHPDLFQPETVLLYHNEDGRHFREVSKQAGLTMPGKGLGVAIADYDRDGYPDFFIANDAMQEFLFHNKRNGTFEEVALESEIAVDGDGGTYSGMGVDFADYNNDGWPDAVVSTLANQKYALYANSKDGSFTYSTYATGYRWQSHGDRVQRE